MEHTRHTTKPSLKSHFKTQHVVPPKYYDEFISERFDRRHHPVTIGFGSICSHRIVGPSEVIMYDTSLRDGAQGESVSVSCDDKLKIASHLAMFGMDYIEAGWPSSNPKDAQFFSRAQNELDERVRNKLVAFGSTRRKHTHVKNDSQICALVDSGVPNVCLVAKAHKWQVTDIIRTSPEENVNMIYESVAFLSSCGKSVLVDMEHFFDGYKHDSEYTMECCRAAVEGGACALVLCDTNGGSMPWEIEERTSSLVKEFNVTIGIHAHNDCGMAVANSIIAAKSGAGLIQGTINGIGERAGNADLCSIIPSLALHVGSEMMCARNLPNITSLSRFVDETMNRKPNSVAPFVGASAFAHKGGLHVAAMQRNPMSYQHIDPLKVGNKKRFLISELSGRQNILVKIKKHCVENDSEEVVLERASTILKRVKYLESIGYTFEGAEASVDIMILHATKGYCPQFVLLDYSVQVFESHVDPLSDKVNWLDIGEGGVYTNRCGPTVRATVKVRTMHLKEEDGDTKYTKDKSSYIDILQVSDGNGPVEALAASLLKALIPYHPSLGNIELSDYKVRILDQESTTGAATRVMIEFCDKENNTTWTTVSVNRNVITASLNALVDGFEYAQAFISNDVDTTCQ